MSAEPACRRRSKILSAALLQACLLTLCLLLSIPAHGAPTNSPGDVLQFLDGAVLHGSFQTMDTNLGLRWRHPDAKDPIDLQPGHLNFVRFGQAQSMSVSHDCEFRFANGDELSGSLVSLDSDTLELTAWLGGTMKVPRSAVQSINFLPKAYSVIYEGPGDASDWVTSGYSPDVQAGAANGRSLRVIQGRVVIIGGVNIGGVNYTSENHPAAPDWAYRDETYTSAGTGPLGRDFHLSRSATLDFDLACAGPFSLWVSIYSQAINRIDINNSGSLFLQLDTETGLGRQRMPTLTNDLGSVTLPDFEKRGVAHITIQCNQEKHTVTLLDDGVVVQTWAGLSDFAGQGGGIVFQDQINGGPPVKLSNFRVSEWDGPEEPETPAVTATNGDLVGFLNHDQATGKIEGITGGKLDFRVNGSLLHIPATRVKSIYFERPAAAVAEPRGPWEVRAVFPGGGSVSFQLEKWGDGTVSGHSALLGSLSFPTDSIRKVEFNLDEPKQDAAAPQVSQYDILDQ